MLFRSPAAKPAAPEASAAPAAILPTELLFTAAAEEEYMEDPQETEKIEEALLAQGYFLSLIHISMR